MHSSMLCADGAEQSRAAMYTNATEFLSKSSGGKAGQFQHLKASANTNSQ